MHNQNFFKMARFAVFGKEAHGLKVNRVVEVHTGEVLAVNRDKQVAQAIANTLNMYPGKIDEIQRERKGGIL